MGRKAKEAYELTGQFAKELQEFIKGYIQSGASTKPLADHLEGMANRLKEGEFDKS